MMKALHFDAECWHASHNFFPFAGTEIEPKYGRGNICGGAEGCSGMETLRFVGFCSVVWVPYCHNIRLEGAD